MTENKTSRAQLDAIKRYKQKNRKRFCVDFYPSEHDLYEHLQSQPSKMAYIKDLIRRDMESKN